MRLTDPQIEIIRSATRDIAGAGASAWLFGSRLDDSRRGGDVDLLIQSPVPIGLLQRARLKSTLEHRLGLPVDVLAETPGDPSSAFVAMVKAEAQRL